MPRQKTNIGDEFWLPLEDGSYSLGQIVEIRLAVLNSITCAFYDYRLAEPEPTDPTDFNLLSVQFVTPDLFRSGVWQRTGNFTIQLEDHLLPYRDTEAQGWIGAKVIGSGIIAKVLSAFYGLRNWHEMHDPDYYQNLLQPGVAPYAAA